MAKAEVTVEGRKDKPFLLSGKLGKDGGFVRWLLCLPYCDVPAYITFTLTPISRAERVSTHKSRIFTLYDAKQQEFLNSVLAQCVKEGVGDGSSQIT